jgi:hypothetical protein
MNPTNAKPWPAAVLLAAVAAVAATSGPRAEAAAEDWKQPAPDTLTTVRQAFDYAYPLVAMGRLRLTQLGSDAHPGASQIGAWRHVRRLRGAEDHAVTAPNADTLYSTLWLDLNRGPVTLDLPDTGGRYASLAFIDMASNDFAMLGRRTTGTRAGRFVVVGPGQPPGSGELPPGARVVQAPSADVLVLARILVDGEADLPEVHALQDGLHASALPGPGAASAPGPVWPHAPSADAGPAGFVDMANLVLERNPPPAYEQPLMQRLAAVGVCGAACSWAGLAPAVQAAWLSQWQAMQASLRGALERTGTELNGWHYPQADLGRFGTDYSYRAQVALAGLLALEPAEALYPTTSIDQGHQPLDGSHRYRLRLPAGFPPVGAFWSLTLYEEEPDGRLFFAANPLRRYAIGDRTPGLTRGADGSVEILIQHEDPVDAPTRSHWLPAPAGRFQLVLRAYEPGAELRDVRAGVPAVERLD